MDTEKCRALFEILKYGSFSAAEQQMGYTPSGLSRMMASLEDDAGFPLLQRNRDGVKPTNECLKLRLLKDHQTNGAMKHDHLFYLQWQNPAQSQTSSDKTLNFSRLQF